MSVKNEEIHIICQLECKEENRERVAELLLEYVEPALSEPGCLYYDIFQERDNPNKFYILDGWANQEAVDAHVKHPNLPRVGAMLGPLVIGKQQLTFGKRISDWSRDLK